MLHITKMLRNGAESLRGVDRGDKLVSTDSYDSLILGHTDAESGETVDDWYETAIS